jgi:hypothetical protein
MTALLESPWPALWLGLIAEALLGVAWYQTGHRRLMQAMAGVVGLVLLLLAIEWLVVTDREQVSNTLEDTARALETNDLDQVLAFLAPEADRLRSDAQRYLPNLNVREANVGGDLEVTINRFTNPPTARATFTGRITGASRGPDRFPHENFVRKFTLKLRQDGDRWLLTDYEMGDLR